MVGTPMLSRVTVIGPEIPWTIQARSWGGSDECSQSSPDSPTTRIGSSRKYPRKRRMPEAFGGALWSAQIQNDGLLLGEMLEHRLEGGLLAEARLLHAAVGHIGLHHQVLVDLHEAGL